MSRTERYIGMLRDAETKYGADSVYPYFCGITRSIAKNKETTNSQKGQQLKDLVAAFELYKGQQ